MSTIARIKRIKQSLTADQAEVLCQQWLPKGKRKARAWVCLSPFRAESTPSFYVYLTDSIGYYDFGSGQRGDMIDLCMKLHNVSLHEVIEAFEQMLGIE